jgi:hypothetical protein
MITIDQFNNEFSKRHDFQYQDIDFLPKKYKTISFGNIPEAWVYSIDHFLSSVNDINKINSLHQFYGQLVIKSDKLSTNDNLLLKNLNNNIRSLDLDLYKQLEEGIVLH